MARPVAPFIDNNVLPRTVRKLIALGDTGLSTGITIETVPAGSIIQSVTCRITVAWDSGTSDAISVGYGAGLAEFVSAQDAQALGIATNVSGALPEYEAVQRVLKAKVVSVGVAATVGQAELIVEYAS